MRTLSFSTGVAAAGPAWALAALVRSPGWVPVLVLAGAVLWLRVGAMQGRAGLAGLALGVGVLGLTVHPAVLVLLAVPGGSALVRRRPVIRELPADAAQEARRIRRVFRLATSDAGEVRVHDLGPRLLAAHDRATRVVLAARMAAARLSLARDLLRGAAIAGTVLGGVLITLWGHGDGAAGLAAAWAGAAVAHHAYR